MFLPDERLQMHLTKREMKEPKAVEKQTRKRKSEM
jgi:hypothetical protein